MSSTNGPRRPMEGSTRRIIPSAGAQIKRAFRVCYNLPMAELESALAAAHAAGDVLRELWPATRQVRVKGFRDIVTEADVAAQQAIVSRLRADFPDYAMLAEEGGGHDGAGDLCPRWIVDPLDGTTNYTRRLPMWAVAVALAIGDEVRLGVVYDPVRDWTFFAERGQGAHLVRADGKPEKMRVSETARLSGAVIGVDWAHDNDVRQEALQAFSRVALACGSARALGTAALGIVCVAPGWLDAYYHFALKPWDVAASSLIVTEAGGCLTTPDGSAWRLGDPRLVVSNSRLHPELLGVMAGR